jgi:hypothetical protein
MTSSSDDTGERLAARFESRDMLRSLRAAYKIGGLIVEDWRER